MLGYKCQSKYLIFIFNRIIDWIKCHIIGAFKGITYKQRNCYTDAVILSQQNEAMLDSKHIGKIEIGPDHSFVDLPEGMPKELLRDLKKI